jgi:hypothetical protein
MKKTKRRSCGWRWCRSEADWEELPAAVAQLPPAGREARRLHRRRAAAHPRPPLQMGKQVIIMVIANFTPILYSLLLHFLINNNLLPALLIPRVQHLSIARTHERTVLV